MAENRIIGPFSSVLILVLIIVVGMAVRAQIFHRMGYTDRSAFPIESAQRYRYIRMVAREGTIPQLDTAVEHPNGFNTRTDTIAQEYLMGYSHRLLSFTGLPLETLIRHFLRFFWLLTIIPIYLIALHTTGSRSAALLSAVFFAVAMPSLRRSLGNEIFREHIAFLPLGLHLYYLLRAMDFRNERIGPRAGNGSDENPPHFYRFALLSALFLILCLVTWKVNRFYYLTLTTFFVFMMFYNSRRAMAVKLLAIFAIINVAASLLLNTPLKYDLFPLSTGMIITYAVLGAGITQLKLKQPFASVAVFAALAAVLWALKPETAYYSHAWETLFTRLRFLSKPDMPSLLPFEARHYWVPPYTSPTLFMFLNDFFLPLTAASISVGVYLKRAFTGKSTPSEELLLYMLLAFLFFYLLFYKLMTFFIFFTAIFLATSLSRGIDLRRGWRYAALILVAAAVMLGAHQSQTWDESYPTRFLKGMGLQPMSIPQAIPDGATAQLIDWYRENTEKSDATLAEFPVSAALLAYAERPVVLHTLFEGENRSRFREFSFALKGDEEKLYMLMKKYDARHFVYSAHFFLRTDTNMSYRYTADAMKVDSRWTLYNMHFHPEKLKRFALVYQNSAFRVFRFIDENGESFLQPTGYAPVFDENLLHELRFSTPSGVTNEEAFLYTIVSAYSDLMRGKQLLEGGEQNKGLKLLQRSVKTFPFIPEAHTALAAYYLTTGNSKKADAHDRIAKALNSGQWRRLLR